MPKNTLAQTDRTEELAKFRESCRKARELAPLTGAAGARRLVDLLGHVAELRRGYVDELAIVDDRMIAALCQEAVEAANDAERHLLGRLEDFSTSCESGRRRKGEPSRARRRGAGREDRGVEPCRNRPNVQRGRRFAPHPLSCSTWRPRSTSRRVVSE